MSFLDTLKSLAGGSAEGSASPLPALVPCLLEMLGRGDGLNSLVRSFEQNGMGDIVSSWIGAGRNLPVSPAQIETGLGGERVGQLAATSGLPVEVVKSHLSQALPQLIDLLTPNGHTGDAANLLNRGKELLGACTRQTGA